MGNNCSFEENFQREFKDDPVLANALARYAYGRTIFTKAYGRTIFTKAYGRTIFTKDVLKLDIDEIISRLKRYEDPFSKILTILKPRKAEFHYDNAFKSKSKSLAKPILMELLKTDWS